MPDYTKKAIGFNFKKGDLMIVNGRIRCPKGSERIQNKIEKLLRTELGKYEIYRETGYGVRIKDLLMGNPYKRSFTKAELQREITDTLLKDDEIIAINDFEVTVSNCKMQCSFSVDTVFGKVQVTKNE